MTVLPTSDADVLALVRLDAAALDAQQHVAAVLYFASVLFGFRREQVWLHWGLPAAEARARALPIATLSPYPPTGWHGTAGLLHRGREPLVSVVLQWHLARAQRTHTLLHECSHAADFLRDGDDQALDAVSERKAQYWAARLAPRFAWLEAHGAFRTVTVGGY